MATGPVDVYRSIFNNIHEWLEGTVDGMTPEQIAWQPPGNVVSAGSHYVHHLLAEDLFLNMIVQGKTALAMGEWQGRAGFDEPMPMDGPWADWARRVKVDLLAARAYGQAVYAATDSFLNGCSDDDLAKELDLSMVGWGTKPLSYLLNQIATDGAAHCGEISAVKGLQGLRGYPF